MMLYIVQEREEGYEADVWFIDTSFGLFWKYSQDKNDYWQPSTYKSVQEMVDLEQIRWKVISKPVENCAIEVQTAIYEWLLS